MATGQRGVQRRCAMQDVALLACMLLSAGIDKASPSIVVAANYQPPKKADVQQANEGLLVVLTTAPCRTCLLLQAGYEDDMIDNAIEDEFNENEQSFNPKQYQQRAGVAATTQ